MCWASPLCSLLGILPDLQWPQPQCRLRRKPTMTNHLKTWRCIFCMKTWRHYARGWNNVVLRLQEARLPPEHVTYQVPLFPHFWRRGKLRLAHGGHWDEAEGELAPFPQSATLSPPAAQANPAPLKRFLSAQPRHHFPGLQPAPALWPPALVTLI